MDDTVFDKIQEVDLKKTMEKSYIDYAMSVIASRALPDVRDGLKPVQRRILFSMKELHNEHDKPHRKCARIVGDTMGKYHPHGDSSIYGALVNMAQEWNTRYMLVDGHGNFGSVDGDGAAAMRYTEARLSKISSALLADIDKDTVDFVPNFDETEKEPSVLPARYPNLLVNGTTGIAVGMATNIPPHNLREVISAVVKIIDNRVEENRDTEIEELLEIVKGPDFPTGAQILGTRGINEAYRTGRGKIKIRGISNIETLSNGKTQIVITELPYMVNKANMILKMAELVKLKKIDGITDIRDETNREGMRVVIELRRDVNANIILNQLYKHTQLQDSYGVIMLALVNGEPKVLNLLEMLDEYLKHQKDVVTRRTKYELDKALKRDHIVQGELIALDHIDEVINIIRGSKTTQEAKDKLIQRFGLSDAQAEDIVEMRLKALTGLEREKLENEHAKLQKQIAELTAILGDEKLLLGVIRTEILEYSAKYGDDRRTKIGFDDSDISYEDMIPQENAILVMTHMGYIKRMTVDNFKAQNRGGQGIKGITTIENDTLEDILMTTTKQYTMFFTNFGRAYMLKTYEIPEAGRTARGTNIINLLQLNPGEHIAAMIPFGGFEQDKNLFFVTKKGIIKKTSVMEFAHIRKTGIQALTIRDDDELIEVKTTDKDSEIFMVSKKGMCIRFREEEVRKTGRSSMGVIGMDIADDDEIVGMQLDSQGTSLLIVSEKGMGKRTDMNEFTLQHRGGKGVKCYKITEKTGDVIGVKAVTDEHEIMMITVAGVIIQIRMDEISVIGRTTSGVKLMNLKQDHKIRRIAKVRADIVEDDGTGEDRLNPEDEQSGMSEALEDEDDSNDNLSETAESNDNADKSENDNDSFSEISDASGSSQKESKVSDVNTKEDFSDINELLRRAEEDKKDSEE